MLNRGGNRRNFAEAGRLPILARGRSTKNSVSVSDIGNWEKLEQKEWEDYQISNIIGSKDSVS